MSNITQRQIDRLKDVVNNGLPKEYKSFVDFLFDWYPNFSWHPSKTSVEYTSVMEHPDFEKVNELIKEKYDFDMRQDLLDGMDEVV